MWIPNEYKNTNEAQLYQIMRQYNFAELLTLHEGKIQDTSIPFVVLEEEGMLYGHIAKPNPQFSALEAGQEVTVIFRGPDAYISPNWYHNPESAVPTWDYVKVAVTGIPKVLTDRLEVLKWLETLAAQHEAPFKTPWKPQTAEAYVEKLLRGITLFKIRVREIQGQFKLSQDHPKDHTTIISALEQGPYFKERELAEQMKYFLNTVRLELVNSELELLEAKKLFTEYAQLLEERGDIGFQDVLEVLPLLTLESMSIEGEIFLAKAGNQNVGCGVLQTLNDDIGEIKRVFVRPEFRGKQFGRALMHGLIQRARRRYKAVKLCTNPLLPEAVKLYESLGFYRIPAYYEEKVACPIFMELAL